MTGITTWLTGVRRHTGCDMSALRGGIPRTSRRFPNDPQDRLDRRCCEPVRPVVLQVPALQTHGRGYLPPPGPTRPKRRLAPPPSDLIIWMASVTGGTRCDDIVEDEDSSGDLGPRRWHPPSPWSFTSLRLYANGRVDVMVPGPQCGGPVRATNPIPLYGGPQEHIELDIEGRLVGDA
ncbi:MAG: hypothetical protein CM1200mP36_04080 [Gammaproteobacteria bacterium]|nr:MAG: hypothetical protein CM1200mP36_04080 [Gammaproteobacteria bacterium]